MTGRQFPPWVFVAGSILSGAVADDTLKMTACGWRSLSRRGR